MVIVNHYKTLGVNKNSSVAEVKAAYMRLAAKHHPDRGGDGRVMAELSVAYNVLKNAKSRKDYDRKLALFGGRCPACEGVGEVSIMKGFKVTKKACGTCNGSGLCEGG